MSCTEDFNEIKYPLMGVDWATLPDFQSLIGNSTVEGGYKALFQVIEGTPEELEKIVDELGDGYIIIRESDLNKNNNFPLAV